LSPIYPLSIYVPDLDLQFIHLGVLVQKANGLKGMFPALREAIATVIDPTTLRYVAWSHFESDEIGGLNHWLELAPQAEPICNLMLR
jgi:flavorubredoxin